jgi:hypothetical protein
MNQCSNGYIERQSGGTYSGKIAIDGVVLGDIDACYFEKGGCKYLWLKRRRIMEYDDKERRYTVREREPRWEVYLKKGVDSGNVVSYRGSFFFMHFKYNIYGIWDVSIGMERNRLNLFVERAPSEEQTVINSIKERNKRKE